MTHSKTKYFHNYKYKPWQRAFMHAFYALQGYECRNVFNSGNQALIVLKRGAKRNERIN